MRRWTALGALSLVAAGLVLLPAAPASAVAPGDSWGMDVVGGAVPDANGDRPMSLAGQGVAAAAGRVGGAVEFSQAPSYGTVAGSADDNPGTRNFAMGLVFTSRAIPSSDYSGNLMQKGAFDDPGQVKLQLVPAAQGTVSCRIKGTSGATTIASSVAVDDGGWHTAVCWRSGSQVGLDVDGVSRSVDVSPGSVSNDEPLTLANKGAQGDASDQHFGRTDFASWVVDADARAVVTQQVAGSSRTCDDFDTQAAAQSFFISAGGPGSDPYLLDDDHDGVACESNPCPCATGSGDGSGGSPAGESPKRQHARVLRVVDGDTLIVRLAGGPRAAVQLLGIHAPDPRSGECGARQARRVTSRLLPAGARVLLVSDPSQRLRDRHGRLLRYVQDRSVDIDRTVVRRGYATVRVGRTPFARLARYEAAQASAERRGRGLWGRCLA